VQKAARRALSALASNARFRNLKKISKETPDLLQAAHSGGGYISCQHAAAAA
jgi:hypothetical protein